jgi:hypothetical protein
MAFYFYENWTNTFVKVHRAECSYYNDGQGFQGRGRSTPSGRWSEPYKTAGEALTAARAAADRHANRSVWSVGTCGYCAPA